MKKLRSVLIRCLSAAFFIPVIILVAADGASAADVTVAWDANSEPQLAGYILFYDTVSRFDGTAIRNYTNKIDVGNKTQRKITGMVAGTTYYFAAKAYDTAGRQSAFSKELVYTIPEPNSAPNIPAKPTGPSDGFVQTNYSYDTSGTDPDEDLLTYRFDWGDGNISGWGGAPSRTHSYASDGTYCIKAQSKDTKDLESGWSACQNVNILVDSDDDGVPDDQDAFPINPNETLDTDRDGVGNNADSDDDNDGMPDAWEQKYGLNPLKDDANEDPDNDDISNIDEYNLGTLPDNYEGNYKPAKPVLLSPDMDTVVGLTPMLETEDFSDPNTNDVHAKTQWKIIRVFDDACVFDVTSDAALTSMNLPKQILEEDMEYIWQVRHIDNHDKPSNWSEEGAFVTEFADNDHDDNGVPDGQEVSEILDLDEDGTSDIVQSDIKCVSVEEMDGTSQVCISIGDAVNVFSIESLSVENPNDSSMVAQATGKPDYVEFGMLDFKLLMNSPGDETTVTIYLSKAANSEGKWFKYNPVDKLWQDYSNYTSFSPNRKEVYLILKDGGFGDADGIENGIIVDPLAFGSESDPNKDNDDSALDEIFGDLSCFISAAAGHHQPNQRISGWPSIPGLEFIVAMLLVFVLYIGISLIYKILKRVKQMKHHRAPAEMGA